MKNFSKDIPKKDELIQKMDEQKTDFTNDVQLATQGVHQHIENVEKRSSQLRVLVIIVGVLVLIGDVLLTINLL